MSNTYQQKYDNRIFTLKRRRDFLDKRVIDYKGKNPSRDKAEASALDWALKVVEANSKQALDFIRQEQSHKEERI